MIIIYCIGIAIFSIIASIYEAYTVAQSIWDEPEIVKIFIYALIWPITTIYLLAYFIFLKRYK